MGRESPIEQHKRSIAESRQAERNFTIAGLAVWVALLVFLISYIATNSDAISESIDNPGRFLLLDLAVEYWWQLALVVIGGSIATWLHKKASFHRSYVALVSPSLRRVPPGGLEARDSRFADSQVIATLPAGMEVLLESTSRPEDRWRRVTTPDDQHVWVEHARLIPAGRQPG